MITPEQVQEAIGERIAEIESLYGYDYALWYKIGFMECVNFMVDMNKMLMDSKESEIEQLNLSFNKEYPTSGGIN